jgi:glycine/D-amino acid oxidase-like deaminating enzyme
VPGLIVAEERIYTKEDAGKLLIGGFEAQGQGLGAARAFPKASNSTSCPSTWSMSRPCWNALLPGSRSLETTGIQTFFNGPESFTPDGRPYLGPAPEMPGCSSRRA